MPLPVPDGILLQMLADSPRDLPSVPVMEQMPGLMQVKDQAPQILHLRYFRAVKLRHYPKKYSDRNWEKGMPFSRYIDAAKRHLDKYIMGMTDEDHLAAAAWNILSIMHHEELGQMEFDDMPHYMSDESQKERLKKQLNALYGMKKEEKDHE